MTPRAERRTQAAGRGSRQRRASRSRAGRAGEEPEQGEELEVYGDSAYGSGEARAAYRDAGHDTVIKPKPLQPAVPGGFTLDDFTISEDQGTVTCPAGITRPMSPDPDRDLRRRVRRLPAAPAVHHRQRWPVDDHPPA